MLACARLGAIHSVVFGGFARQGARQPHRRREAEGRHHGLLRHRAGRVVPYKPLLDAAIDRSPKPARCIVLQRPMHEADLVPDRDLDWTSRGDGDAGTSASRSPRPIRSTSSTPPARRAAEGRGARQRRTRGRAQLDDEERLRRRAGRGLLGGLGHRLGGRPLVHRLRAAPPRLHDGALRRQAGRHARRRRLLARHLGAQARSRSSPRRPPSAPSKEGGPGRQAHRRYDLSLPHALPRRRARRSRHRALGGSEARGAGDRPLVADRDRLGRSPPTASASGNCR